MHAIQNMSDIAERRSSTEAYTPCSGLFPSHAFKGPLATYFVVLIYGGQMILLIGLILAIAGFTADIRVLAYMGPILGTIGLCMAASGCTVHKRSQMQTRVSPLTNNPGHPDSVRDIYKQLAASVFLMATFLGIIFLTIGIASHKSSRKFSDAIYFEILGPVLIGMGVIGTIVVKCIENQQKKTKRPTSTKPGGDPAQSISRGHTVHLKASKYSHEQKKDPVFNLSTISAGVHSDFQLPSQKKTGQSKNKLRRTVKHYNCDFPKPDSPHHVAIEAQYTTPDSSTVDDDNQTQYQWQNAYQLNTWQS